MVTDILWETEGQTREACELPDAVIVVDCYHFTGEVLRQKISEQVSDAFGFSHSGLSLEPVLNGLPATHPGGGYFPSRLAAIQLQAK